MPSLSNAPVTVRLIVVPLVAASAALKVPALKALETTPVAAAALAPAAAALETPLEVLVVPALVTVGIEGTVVEILALGVLGMLIVGAVIFAMSLPPKMLFAKL